MCVCGFVSSLKVFASGNLNYFMVKICNSQRIPSIAYRTDFVHGVCVCVCWYGVVWCDVSLSATTRDPIHVLACPIPGWLGATWACIGSQELALCPGLTSLSLTKPSVVSCNCLHSSFGSQSLGSQTGQLKFLSDDNNNNNNDNNYYYYYYCNYSITSCPILIAFQLFPCG